jgi:hypothetical protein
MTFWKVLSRAQRCRIDDYGNNSATENPSLSRRGRRFVSPLPYRTHLSLSAFVIDKTDTSNPMFPLSELPCSTSTLPFSASQKSGDVG